MKKGASVAPNERTDMKNRSLLSIVLLLAAVILLVPLPAHADLGDKVQGALQSGSFLAYALVFVGGVLTSLTPCVYPLIPITLSIFGARGEGVSRARGMALAATYVGGMATMYTSLGVSIALVGKSFGTFLANPWFIVPVALVFLLMSASMFGFFEMNLPPSLAERLNRVGGAGYPGAFGMGLVGGIIAAPCTGPVLASILTYVATTRSVFFGGSLLFTYALGMGVLFFALAATAASLPRSGPWMEAVKSVFGIVMILAALYFLRNVWPLLGHYGDWTPGFAIKNAGLLLLGVALGGIHLGLHGPTSEKLRKALGVALITGGAFGLIAWVVTPRPVSFSWVRGEVAALEAARRDRKPVLLDFSAEWCNPCKKMDVTVFTHEGVQRELARFVAGKIDMTEDSDENDQLKVRYSASTLPTIVLLDKDLKPAHRWNREVEPEELLEELRKIE